MSAPGRWIKVSSTNFEMYTTASPRSARETIHEFEQVRSFFLQLFTSPDAKTAGFKLIVFGSAAEFEPYKPTEFAAAFYQETSDREYIVMSHAGEDTFPTAVHEYVHMVVRHDGLKFPPWLNEGLAELYSTLRPLGGKVLVGDLIPGRHRALLEDKWVPLQAILAADRTSPYYNEKNKAGSLYNEGWALTHMLALTNEYRPKFGELMRTISNGTDSAAAVMKVYGLSVAQLDKNLQNYLRGNSFQGLLVQAKLENTTGNVPEEALGEFDAQLVLADLLNRPGKEAAHQQALEKLAQQDPKRPEPIDELGYVALRAGRSDEALQQFGKAFELGDRNNKFLWDYGRLLESKRPQEAIRPFSDLLKIDGARMDVRLELADSQVRAGHPKEALDTLAATQKITSADAGRYFRIAVTAALRNNDPATALATAKHFQDVAKTDQDRELAQFLIRQASPRSATAPAIASASGDRPQLQRAESPEAPLPMAPRHQLASASGKFVELDCREKQPRMIVDTAEGKKIFVIEHPDNVVITAGSDGPVEMECGPQKTPAKVDVGYEPAPANLPGVLGLVRTLAF